MKASFPRLETVGQIRIERKVCTTVLIEDDNEDCQRLLAYNCTNEPRRLVHDNNGFT